MNTLKNWHALNLYVLFCAALCTPELLLRCSKYWQAEAALTLYWCTENGNKFNRQDVYESRDRKKRVNVQIKKYAPNKSHHLKEELWVLATIVVVRKVVTKEISFII